MKKSRIIAPALGVLVLSTAASITGTVAWFTANNTAKVTGMVVTTKVQSNVLVSADNTLANFKAQLDQTRSGAILEPVSTVDGKTFFYTNDATASGSAIIKDGNDFIAYNESTNGTNENAGKTKYDTAFNSVYSVTPTVEEGAITSAGTRYGYIDYDFYLQATNVEGAARNLVMTECNLQYYDSENTKYGALESTDKAWRIAMFAKESVYTSGTTTPAIADTGEGGLFTDAENLKSILRVSGAQNFSELDNTPSVKAVSGVDAKGAVTYTNPANVGTAIANGQTKYYRVVVRLWLEGEDTTCNNSTYAELTANYKLSLGFALSSSTGLANIQSIADE